MGWNRREGGSKKLEGRRKKYIIQNKLLEVSGSDFIFYLLGIMTLVFGVMAVTSRQIFRSAIYLLFTLIGIAGIYFWLEYEFIAAVQIIVYVGGIVVLIIFSILLTQQAGEKLPAQKTTRKIAAALAAFSGLALVMVQVLQHSFVPTTLPAIDPGIKSIGTQLLNVDQNGLALPFEVISILLLAAMIGCIVIAMREKQEARS